MNCTITDYIDQNEGLMQTERKVCLIDLLIEIMFIIVKICLNKYREKQNVKIKNNLKIVG